MSMARDQLRDVILGVLDEYFEDPDDYEDHIKPMADDLIAALTANEFTAGWLITGSDVYQVEETDLTDPGDENWTYVVYCEVPDEEEGHK